MAERVDAVDRAESRARDRLVDRLRRSRARDLDAAYRRALTRFATDGLADCIDTDAPADAIGTLYERLLALVPTRTESGVALRETRTTRRRRGSFFTPRSVADMIVAETIPRRARGMRVLDPAVGGGAFLLAAAARLRDHAPRLSGIDRDAGAVAAARAALERGPTNASRVRLECADALADDSAVLRSRYDIVVGNPPYLSVKRGRIGIAPDERFATARGQFDAWSLFVELALDRLVVGGRYGLLLPRPVLAAETFAPIRRRLFAGARLERVIALGQCFPGASVEAVALVGRRGARGRALVRIDHTATPPTRRTGPAPAKWARRPGAPIAFSCGDRELAFLARLERLPARVGDHAAIARGLECGRRDPAIVAADHPGARPLITGAAVGPYSIADATGIRLDRLSPRRVKDPAIFAARPKLLVRRVTDRPCAAVDESGAWALNTLYVLRPHEDIPVHALCAWLNSAAIRRYHALAFESGDRLFPYLRASQLRALPAPDAAVLAGPLGRRLARAARGGDAARVDRLVDGFLAEDRRLHSAGGSGSIGPTPSERP